MTARPHMSRDGSRFPVEISDGLLVSATVRDVSERTAAGEKVPRDDFSA